MDIATLRDIAEREFQAMEMYTAGDTIEIKPRTPDIYDIDYQSMAYGTVGHETESRQVGDELVEMDLRTFAILRVNLDKKLFLMGNVNVNPDYRNDGKGRQMWLAAERICQHLGITEISDFVLGHPGEFWKAMGYTAGKTEVGKFPIATKTLA